MINKIITSEGNVQFIYGDSGKIINVHPFHVYTVFNVDTVSFLLIAMPKDSGLAIFTTKAEDLEINGETYTFEELPNALSEAFAIAGAQARAEIVDELPETGMTNTIYLVPKEDGHGYDEYIYIKETGTWELIGDTDIELSRYVKKTDFNAYTAQTAAKIDYLSGATDAEVARATSAETALDEKIDGKVIELTQAEYDALAEIDPKVIYVITDAVPVNMADYVKKVDFNSYSAATKTAMDNETSARTNADTAEQTAREAADSFISGAVDTLSTALANEVQRAQNAESGLSEDIEDEMTRAMVIEDALDDKIDAVSAATDDALALKLDASAYTVDSSVIENSVNPVQGGALYDELRIEGEPSETTLEWDNHDGGETTNYPNGVSTIKIEVVDGSEGDGNAYSFFDENYEQLGYISVLYNDGDVTVGSDYVNVTYSISGNVVTVNYPTIAANVTAIGSSYDNVYTIKAIGESSVISVKDQVAANTAAIDTKQPLLQAGENITISGNVISAEGGGKAIEAGRGIAITSGETADTVALDVKIYQYSNSNLEVFGHPYVDQSLSTNSFSEKSSSNLIIGNNNEFGGTGYINTSTIIGTNNKFYITNRSDTQSRGNAIIGESNILSGNYILDTVVVGGYNSGHSRYEFASGFGNECKTVGESSFGEFNISNSASTTFGDSGNTLFSVGNGTNNNNRHNAFEIRQNGDIYLSSGGTDIKLQDYLGGGGGTVESAITSGSTNAVESKAIWSATTYNKEITLQWDNGFPSKLSTNYPSGCKKFVVTVLSNTNTLLQLYNGGSLLLGYINISNYSSPSVSIDTFEGITYTISGNDVTFVVPDTITFDNLDCDIRSITSIKAIVEGAWIADNTYMKEEVDTIASGLQTNINSKLDATAYTPVTIDSTLNVASTNPVQNQALYSELRINNGGETETTLVFEGEYSTNYPNGCTQIKVEVVGSNNGSNISFYNDLSSLGAIMINNWGFMSVENHFDGATYEISGTTVIISYPTVTNVTRIQVNAYSSNYTYKAVTTEAPTVLKDQVVANTTALGGLKLQQISQSDYDNLSTKDNNTLYVII